MATLRNVTFTPDEINRFSTITSFGVPFGQLKQFIALSADQQKKYPQPGIPTDSVSNDLSDWVREARKATAQIHNKPLQVAIKGDSKEDYPIIKTVIDIFQKQKLNKFSLITDLGNNFNGGKK